MTGASPSKKVGATSLMYACQQGKDTQVINIVNTKPGAVLERERTLKTALHYCAESGDGGVSSAAVLLEAAPELVLAQDQDGYSALHLAVIAGNLALTKLLISHGAPVNMPDNEGHTPAHWATVCGEIDCLELLLGKGCDPNMGDMHGGCPLHYAAQMCGPFSDMPADRRLGMAALRILLDSSSDPNLPDNHGRQPILWAASAGSSEAILVLVGAGASVAAADKDGLTALHCAASRGHTDCVETLINLCSAEPDVIDNNGCSALFYAVTLGHADATQTLLNHGSSTNRQDRKGRTAVHCGAAKGQLETLKVVAAWGGNMWQKTVRGDYPLHDAVASGRRPLVHWLLSQRPDSVNSPNNDGRCPLHIAAIHNNIEMCKTLLDAGSLVNPVMRTAKGALATPLDAALHKGHRGCAKYLQLHGGVPASRLNSESAALRGLSSNRGEGNRTSIPHISKEQLEEKLEAVEEVEVQSKPEMKPPLTETPTSDDHNHVNEKERIPSSTRPHILQVYVEDDLMIRKLRHYEGSDSSIEERVRRRRRKRKTKLMTEREKSAPPRISPRRMSSSDETVDPKRSAYAKDQADTQEKDTMVEKLVQTEFSVQPDSLQSHFESLIIESIKEDATSSQQVDQSNQTKETKTDKTPTQGTSSGDSDKKSSVQIVEAVVHKEQKSGESDEHKTSSKEHKTSSEEHKASSGEHKTSSEEHKASSGEHKTSSEEHKASSGKHKTSSEEHKTSSEERKTSSEERKASSKDLSKTAEAQTKETRIEQLNNTSKQPESSVVPENSSETLGDKKLPEMKIDEGNVKQDAINSENDANQAGQTTKVEANDSQKLEKKSDKDISISQQTDAGSDGSGLPQMVTTKGTQGPRDAGNQHVGDKSDVHSDKESNGRKVPNDKLVAQVLFQSMQEDEMLSSNQPSSSAVDGASKDVKPENQGGSEAFHEEHKSTHQIGEVETEQKPILHQEDILTSEVAPREPTNVKEHDAEEVQFSTDERTKALADGYNDSKVLNNESFIHNEVTHDAKHDSLVSIQSGNKVAASDQPADYFHDQNNFSKDSFDIEGSLDELTLNMTKDSDDLPPEMSLPEPIVNENWDKTLEADRVAADVLLANEDRGLLKVLGDPTGGSSYVADKRRKLRKKREGNKKWMNSRSTESFEILKISDEKTDEEGVSDVDKPREDDNKEKVAGKENIQIAPSEQRRISRPCRRGYESGTDVALSTVSVTQAVQYSVRKYHLERRIFHQLLELKRLQIRAGRASEAVLVKRLVDEYKRAGLMLGLQQYDGVYTFRSFEKFLYEQLRLLQTSERRIIPRLRSTDDLERLTAALRKTRVGQEILASVPNNPALCTYQTHRCHHATHAYTGIPCAAYIARPNHHTMPKPTTYTGFLPKLVNDENQAEVAKTLRHVDPSRPLTLELSHGPDKQVITLPTEKLDKSKKYFVTFTIKSGNQRKNDMKHSHATSI